MRKLCSLVLALAMLMCFAAAEPATYPLNTDETLTMWLHGLEINSSYTDYNDWPFFMYLEEASGVHVTYYSPVQGTDANQAFNLMISSGELPDMVYISGISDRGAQLIEDGYIIALNDYMHYAPALSALIAKSDVLDKSLKTDNGDYYAFPFLRENLSLGTWYGLCVNTSLLEQVGMDMPVTITDWNEMLYAIKDLCEYPLIGGNYTRFRGMFSNAFGFQGIDDYYVEDGKVKTWMNAEGYKDMMTMLARWMSDGIIDPDILTMGADLYNQKMASHVFGACCQGTGSPQGYIKTVVERDGGFYYEAVPYPVNEEGDEIRFTQGEGAWSGVGACITTACKNVELAMRWLDFNYTEAGIYVWNYGKEGVSYEMVDGLPQYTALITEANEPMREATSRHCGINGHGFSVMQVYFDQIRNPAIASEYASIWGEHANETVKYRMPTVSTLPEEDAELNDLSSAITTYANEMYVSFLIGSESLDNYDQYLANLESMNIDRLLEIKQAQYDRFLAR